MAIETDVADAAATAPDDIDRAGGDAVAEVEGPPGGVLPDRWRLFSLTFLMLFVELTLIRWLGANVVYMSYYSNFVLLGSFLGFGLGFLWAGRSRHSLFPYTPILLGSLVAFVYMFEVPLKWTSREVIFFETVEPDSPLPRWLVLVILFVAVAVVTAAIGDGVARTFGRFEPLEAYRLDLLGSVAGIAAFSALSFLGARPLVWGVFIAVVLLLTLKLTRRNPFHLLLAGVGLALLLVTFGYEARSDDVIWSPYYRITHHINGEGGIGTKVNQSPHWEQIPATTDSALYETVYERTANSGGGDVLVIGAGSGNDVAYALARGADHVDAVEIDNRLMSLAQTGLHQDAYDDPRVDTHIDDGRAFLERSDKKWDRILLALPDSLALVTGQSAIRLESYLFTVEAAEAAQEHLAPGGSFSMYNFYREDWLVDRYANTLAEVFEQPPCVSRYPQFGLGVLTAADDAAVMDCPADEQWAATSGPSPVRDDRPFPYLLNRTVPSQYIFAGLGMLALSVLAVVAILGPGGKLRSAVQYSDLFFMGVAFMLLETKSVTQFALLFGTTWFVNSLVFLGVLLSVLVAVAVSRRVTFKRPALLYLALLAGLALAFVVPPNALLDLAVVPRFVAAVSLAFFPIFAANLVFTQRFKSTASSTIAFGANLLGAMVGGLLEYTALVTGFRGLLVLVALAYGLAFLTGRKHLLATPAAA